MVKQKRSTTASSEFIGFSAFATHSSSTAAAMQLSKAREATGTPARTNQQRLKPNPIYSGNDSKIVQIFKSISKKDPTTKSRALAELSDAVYPCNGSNIATETQLQKHELITVLSHFFFLFRNKLIHDNNSSVQIEAINVFGNALQHVPKACYGLLRHDASDDVLGRTGNVVGWTYCYKSSQNTEVSRVAARVWKSMVGIFETIQNNEKDDNVEDVLKGFVVSHMESILQSSSRATNLAAALSIKSKNGAFAQKKDGKLKKGKNNESSKVVGPSESEKEEWEELYERVVLLTLRAMDSFLREYPEEECTKIPYSSVVKTRSVLWKHLASPKSNFRRATFSLISCATQNATSLIHGECGEEKKTDFSSLLLNALASERDPSNFATLFEMILSYIASFRILEGGIKMVWVTKNTDYSGIDPNAFTKSMSKTLRRCCYGSPSSQWGPMMLPILATLQSSRHQIQLLTNLWNGKTAAVTISDAMGIVSAVTECSMYLLVQSNSNGKHKMQQEADEDIELAKDVAQLFLECLSYFVGSSAATSSSALAEKEVVSTLIRDLCKLENLPLDRKDCRFHTVREWFWSEGLSSVVVDLNSTAIQRLTTLLSEMAGARNVNAGIVTGEMSFCNFVKKLFWNSILPQCGSAPTYEHISLLLSLLECYTTNHVFSWANGQSESRALNSFCTEKIVPWIILSSKDLEMSEILFKLLFLVMKDLSSLGEMKTIWEKCLHEIIRSCQIGESLEVITVGISMLAERHSEMIEKIRCETFDNYAISISNLLEAKFRNQESSSIVGESHPGTELSFLRLSSGLEGRLTKPILGSGVINTWVETLSSGVEYGVYKERHLLLDTMLSLARSDCMILDSITILKIAMSAWKEGGSSWISIDLKNILASNDSLRHDLAKLCAGILRSEIRGDSFLFNRKTLDFDSYLWAERASRGLSIHRNCHNETSTPLQFVGFGDIDIWERAINDKDFDSCDSLYLCLLYLLQKIPSESERRNLFMEGTDSNILLGIHIFMALVTFDGKRTERCSNLLITLGGDLVKPNIEQYLFSLIKLLSQKAQEGSVSDLYIARATVVLDWFIGLLLIPVVPVANTEGSDGVDQNEVKVGDELWYVTDSSDTDADRVKGTILKVHTDDFPNLYFTIRLSVPGKDPKMKQTVAERLKRYQQDRYKNGSLQFQAIDPNNLELIQRIEETTVAKLVKPFIQGEKENTKDMAAEVLNCVISHCGLRGQSGIGTTRYEVFKTVNQLEKELFTALSGEEPNMITVSACLRRLAIVLGYGTLTSYSRHNGEILKYDCWVLINHLRSYLDDNAIISSSSEGGASLRSALMMWAVVSAPVATNPESCLFLWEMAEDITTFAASEKKASHLPNFILMMLRGLKSMSEGSALASNVTTVSTTSSKHTCTANLLTLFSTWKASPEYYHLGEYFIEQDLTQERNEPFWIQPFREFIVEEVQNESGAITHGACTNCKALIQSLSCPIKQWCAFQILFVSARKAMMLFAEEDVEIDTGTEMNLQKWQEGLHEEEALEIEDDVLTTAQWIPQPLMSKIESWNDEVLGDNQAITARLLQWLLCLQYLDTAGISDMRNRGHIVSYYDKVDAIEGAFNIAMSFADLSKQEQNDLFGCISINSHKDYFPLSQLSTLAVFRSIETMPTPCKVWWNEKCSRSLQTEVHSFVESMVAPETLRREIARINKASGLGDLSVSGSCVSREIIATYLQDECKLSVAIRIPSSFPLRNAEVDCKRTLGISEKRWRFWSLQIMQMLNNQDGSILDALLLWKQNVDKEFDGVEPCPVCYSVLCVKTHAMPNLECKTCHNRFHSSCLYKWFNSSGKNQCVLCQQPWSGTKVA